MIHLIELLIAKNPTVTDADPGFCQGRGQLWRLKVADEAKRVIFGRGLGATLGLWKLLGFKCSDMNSPTF